jgi:hypothetical protein
MTTHSLKHVPYEALRYNLCSKFWKRHQRKAAHDKENHPQLYIERHENYDLCGYVSISVSDSMAQAQSLQ